MCINWFQLRLLLNSNTLYRIEVTWDGYTMCFNLQYSLHQHYLPR